MKTRLFALFATLCLLALPVFAESAAAIRGRMEQRLPQIDTLKAQEFVGENNRGFLEERKSGGANAGAVVADENRDRQEVYTLLAQQTGSTPDSVGKARAKQIAANSRGGVWVQDESGAWKKK
jgi:uncharacterized protein YdbL (DUF1318 family)